MRFSEFLEELFAEGRVAVPAPAELSAEELAAAEVVLERQDCVARLELPAGLPQLERKAALCAATQFYRACQYAMFRDIGKDAIVALSKSGIEGWERANAHYSVDLTFRFLPDLVKIAQSASTDDPLVDLLQMWGRRWPLSSVGMPGIGADIELGPIAGSSCLMTMYVDRITGRGDVERSKGEPVRNALRHALGLYTNLAPDLALVVYSESEGNE